MRLLDTDPIPLAVTPEEFEHASPWIEADDYHLTIEAFLRDAQEVVEVASRRPLTERNVELEFELVGGFCRWWMPVAPVSAITSAVAVQPLEDDVTIPVAEMQLLRQFDEPCLYFSEAAREIADPCIAETVKVHATVGYAEGQAPNGLKRAIILLVKDWYDEGISVGGVSESKATLRAKDLIKQQRYERPKVLG